MSKELKMINNFSCEQWEFIATLDAFGEAISVDVVGELSPLKPKHLLQVVQDGIQLQMIQQAAPGEICLVLDISEAVRQKVEAINSRDRLNRLLEGLTEKNLTAQVPASAIVCLLTRAGKFNSAAAMERDLARTALNSRRLFEALSHLGNCLQLCALDKGNDSSDVLYLEAALEYSSLVILMGVEIDQAIVIMEKAKGFAKKSGDRRTLAMLYFISGIAAFLLGKSGSVIDEMDKGRLLVEELADPDILYRSSFYLGFYHYFRGELETAVDYLRRVTLGVDLDAGSLSRYLYTPIVLCSCLSYMNQFYQAIGLLEYHWLKAKELNIRPIETTMRATLGIMLVRIDRHTEALPHLNGSLSDALADRNAYGEFMARSGLAFHYFRKDRFDETREMLLQIFGDESVEERHIQYLTPMHLEMIWGLNRLSLPSGSPLTFERYFDLIIDGGSLHNKGAAYRLRAQQWITSGRDGLSIKKDLETSEQMLTQSGDQYELAKTRAVLAQQLLKEGDTKRARLLANQARKGLTGHGERYFPSTLHSLFDKDIGSANGDSRSPAFQELVTNAIKDAWIPLDVEEGFSGVIASVNRILESEKGGLFYSESGKERDLELRVLYNLSQNDIHRKGFKSQNSMIQKCFQQNRIYQTHEDHHLKADSPLTGMSRLYLPLMIKGNIQGVVYFENDHDKSCFTWLGEKNLKWLAVQLGLFFELTLQVNQAMTETCFSVLKRSGGQLPRAEKEMIHSSRIMEELLIKTDRAAASESSVLITGETGVGKEMLARRLHKMSTRSERPFVVFAPGLVPENLVESELFGHEKGSFTGAEQRRLGLVELADKGTLFIDEVGEFSPIVQIKLLRVLQEKTFRRVGASQDRHSDFRLVAATNRDILQEVSSDQFREDLLYRINTVTLHVPALREREEDVVELANFFLNRFVKKYRCHQLSLTRQHIDILKSHTWRGNVRELKNIIEQAVVMSDGSRFELNLPKTRALETVNPFEELPRLDELQSSYIKFVLEKTGGRISGPGGAAEIMGIKRTTLYNRMQKLGIRRADAH